MSDEYPTGMFYVYAKDGTPVEAMYLRDDFGVPIMDESNNRPYIVPWDFSPALIIDRYSNLGFNGPSQNADSGAVGRVMAALYNDFHAAYPGSRFDIQRTYNGIHITDSSKFVPAFTPAASWAYGFAMSVVGFRAQDALFFGGLQNIKSSWSSPVDTSGAYYNAPVNVPDILTGFADYSGGGTSAIDPPDATYHSKVYQGGVQYSIDISVHDRDSFDETTVQVGTNMDTGEKSVSIQGDEWGVVFGSNDEVDWWSNATDETPPDGVYDCYDDGYDYGGYGRMGGKKSADSQTENVSQDTLNVSQLKGVSPSGRFVIPVTANQYSAASHQYENLVSAIASFEPKPPGQVEELQYLGADTSLSIVAARA